MHSLLSLLQRIEPNDWINEQETAAKTNEHRKLQEQQISFWATAVNQ